MAAFVKNIGTAAGTASSLAVTVPAGGAAAGNLLVVCAGSQNGDGKTITGITDSRGNTYAEVQTTNATTNGAMVWRSLLGTALQSGDTITVSFSSKQPWRVSVNEYSVVATTEDGKDGSQGSSTTPSVSITPANATNLVVTCLLVEDGASDGFTEDGDSAGGGTWNTLTSVTAGDTILRGAYKITTSATTQTYDPTLGTSRPWTNIIAALQASAGQQSGIRPAPLRLNQAVTRAAFY